jgi:hypothetical protein
VSSVAEHAWLYARIDDRETRNLARDWREIVVEGNGSSMAMQCSGE